MLLAGGEIGRTGCKNAWNEGRRYKLWWSGKGNEVDGVGVMVKEQLSEKRRVSDDCCCCFFRVCAEVDMCVCFAKWKKFLRKAVFL